jgi:hypothetical protein
MTDQTPTDHFFTLRSRSFLKAVLALGVVSIGVACGVESPDTPPGTGGTGGSGGSSGTGSGATAGIGGSAGAAAGQSGAGGTTGGSAGAATGGSTTGGAGSGTGGQVSGGAGAGGASGGAPTGGTAGVGAGGSTGGVAGAATGGAAGSGAGAGSSGASGSSSGGGTAGETGGGKSDLPPPPTTGVPRPSGTPGDITVLDWAGFKGAVTYSFDDNNTTQIQNYTELNALGVRYTFYLWTGKSEAMNSIWMTARDDGHELANHTQSHQSNGTGQDIDAATTFIEDRFGVTPYTMAAPNGASGYTQLARGRFIINRGVGYALIAPNDNSDPFTLPTFIPNTGANAAAFNQRVDDARAQGRWVTMCIHGFQGGTDGAYQPVPLNEFIASVQHAKDLGDMWIDTMRNVGAYWLGQKTFSNAMTMTSGSGTTWTWTLPDDFPPGHYLRVTVDGGTLTQNGVALAWDDHGYYEIALDEGSVTLSP